MTDRTLCGGTVVTRQSVSVSEYATKFTVQTLYRTSNDDRMKPAHGARPGGATHHATEQSAAARDSL